VRIRDFAVPNVHVQSFGLKKHLNDIGPFGHDGSFGHDGAIIKRAPSSAAKYSNVSIAVPDPPLLGRESSAAATPKLFTHCDTLSNSIQDDTQVTPMPGKRIAFDMLFNTAPSTFKPTGSVRVSQTICSDVVSVHSVNAAISDDGTGEWFGSDKASDIPSEHSKLMDVFDGMHLPHCDV
jgi:hypothetical protein